jgi:hypothetical protein
MATAALPMIERIVRGTIHIQNCTLSIIGGVQPSRIAPLVRGAMSGTSNDGLLQRLQMTVWPDDICSWRWVDRKPDRDARDAFEDVFRYLSTLPRGFQDKPHVLRFTPEAQNLYREWMQVIQVEARSGAVTSTLESHILKMPKTVASLALIFELIDGGLQFVGEEATRLALGWADYLRSHANRLYAAGQTMTEEGARLIVERRGQLPDPFDSGHPAERIWPRSPIMRPSWPRSMCSLPPATAEKSGRLRRRLVAAPPSATCGTRPLGRRNSSRGPMVGSSSEAGRNFGNAPRAN